MLQVTSHHAAELPTSGEGRQGSICNEHSLLQVQVPQSPHRAQAPDQPFICDILQADTGSQCLSALSHAACVTWASVGSKFKSGVTWILS